MESVDPAFIQVFALTRFREAQAAGLYGAYSQRLRGGRPILKGDSNIVEDVNRFAYGIVLERRGLFQMGKEVGYLPLYADNDEIYLHLQLVAEYSKGSNRWPLWFGTFAIRSVSSVLPFDILPEVITSGVTAKGIFQSALVLAERFNEPAIFYLQRALQDESSCLDKPEIAVSGHDLWSELLSSAASSVATLLTIESCTRCVAGFIGLTEVLACFDRVFPSEDISPSSTARKVLGKTIANLLQWRLNLFDQRTADRLTVVAELFWKICDTEFRTHPENRIVWSREDSRKNLKTLLDNWKSRADPDPEMDGPPIPPEGNVGGLDSERTKRTQERKKAGVGASTSAD